MPPHPYPNQTPTASQPQALNNQQQSPFHLISSPTNSNSQPTQPHHINKPKDKDPKKQNKTTANPPASKPAPY